MRLYKANSKELAKKITIVIFIAIGAINLMGCSTDETIIDLPNDSAVSFNTYIARETQSRAASMDNTKLQKGFGVFAYYTENATWTAVGSTAYPNFMYNEQITHVGGDWTYSPVKYWPNNTNDKVSFFAYAPYEEAPDTGVNKGITFSSKGDSGAPTIDFTVNTTSIKDQVDLVYASELDKNRELVDFQFKHALSRIGFVAKAAGEYGITNISLKSVSLTGNFYQSGTFNFSNDGLWSNFVTSTTTDITYKPTLKDGYDGSLTTTENSINKDDQYIMIIPQNFKGDNKVTVTATYTTITNNGTASRVESPEKTISKNLNLSFEKSKAYIVLLNISLDNVVFNLATSDWAESL